MLAALLASALLIPPAHQGPQRAGVAVVDVTPSTPIRLAGYASRTTEANTVEQHLFAKALAIADGDAPPVVIVTLDSTGITAAIRERVLAAIHDTGLDPARVALCVTHSHNAPMLTGTIPNMFGMPVPADQQQRIDDHTAHVVDGMAQAIRAALADLQPAVVDHARGQAGFARNRRTAGGPVDHDVPLLRVRAPGGELRALLVLYACHCTTLGGDSNMVCGDWAGYAQQMVQEAHPGCTTMVAIGCGADANPEPRGALAMAKQHGRELADEIERLLKGPFAGVQGAIQARLDEVELAFGPIPTRTELLARVSQGGGVGYHARVQLARLDRGEALRTSIRLPVQSFCFGDDLAMVFIGGEVVVDYVLRLRREYDRTRLWVAGYSNDVPAYIPSERILKEGGYEGGGAMVWYDQPTAFAPGLEQKLVDAVHAQVPASFLPYADIDPARTEGVPPRDPKRALASLAVAGDLRVELAACEPQIESPVAIDFAPDGSIFVCEMRDYPTVGGPRGRVSRLRDRDHDGHFETVERFLDPVTLPTGVMAWNDGAIVCTAPEVIFARDTDGDGIADERRVLLRGFADGNEQALVNSPSLGLDGGVYFACGLFGGTIESPRAKLELDLRGRDFRLEPDSGALTAQVGQTQQGRVRNDFGDWFGCDSGTLAWHYPLPARDLQRNPHYAAHQLRVPVAEGDDPDRMFQISVALERYNEPAAMGRTTSACGIAVLRDDVLGEERKGDLFVCEPVANVVHHLHVEADGASFHGDRAEGERTREFLASTDPWFRPVQVRTGPDGALWVVDMARFLIEHPRWVPQARMATIDARAGDRLGRIWRVMSASSALRPMPDGTSTGPAAIAQLLLDPNGTRRDLAQMQLCAFPPAEVVAALHALASQPASAESRVQIASILDPLGGLDSAALGKLLHDSDPRVARVGVRLARRHLRTDAALHDAVLALADSADAGLRFEVALALGDLDDARAGLALARILEGTADTDTRMLDAVFTSALPHVTALVDVSMDRPDILDVLLPMVVARADHDIAVKVLRGLHDDRQLDAARLLAPVLRAEPAWLEVVGRAAKEIGDVDADPDRRVAAAELLGVVDTQASATALIALLAPGTPPPLQQAALRGLGTLHVDVTAPLLSCWDTAAPELRDSLFDLLVRRTDSALALLSRAATDPAFAASLTASRQQILFNHTDSKVRERAAATFAAPRARADVIARYQDIDKIRGDAVRGRETFARVCSVCHLLDGVGRAIGPDLGALSDRSTGFLLDSILDPNKAVRDDFAMYAIAMRDGTSWFGRIAQDDGHHLTLVGADAVPHLLARADVTQQHATGLSLMPEGLEAQVDVSAMADLFAFLRQERRPRREFPGNLPAVIAPAADGSLTLLAVSAEIYGDTLVLEGEFQNLGYWQSTSDAATWTVELPSAGRFTIDFDYACADDSAGSSLVLEGGASPLRATIASTQVWSHYVTARIGEIELPAGRSRLTLRADGPLHGALLDLRGMHLSRL